MQIAVIKPVPIDVNPRDTKLISSDFKTLSFPSLMQAIFDNQAALTQETARRRQSDLACDCDKNMTPCKCGSDKETEDVTIAKKTGIAACMDCSYRKSGQCAMWNGENEDNIFNLFLTSSRDDATQADVDKILDIQTPFDVIAEASPEYNYTYAYAYIRKKLKNAAIE